MGEVSVLCLEGRLVHAVDHIEVKKCSVALDYGATAI